MDDSLTLPGPPEATRRRQRNALPGAVDVAIIGCGLAGLTAGALLSRAGVKVACFDGHYVAGGCGTVFSRTAPEGRYHFDVGLHYVGDCGDHGTIPTLLREAGCAPVTFRPLDPDGFDTVVLPNAPDPAHRTFSIPADVDRYEGRLLSAFPAERRGITRYVRLIRAVLDIGTRLDATRGRMTPGILWRVLTRHPLLARWQHATLSDFLDTCTADPTLRAILCAQHGDYAVPPSRVALLLHAGLAAHYFKGATYPVGGGQILADRLAESIERHGGSIHLSRPIGRVLVVGRRAVGVETAPRKHRPLEQVRARAVISAADLERTLRELVPADALPSDWRARLEAGFEHTAALFLTCLGVRGDLRDLGMADRNYWISNDTDVEALYRDLDGGPPRVSTAYVTSASLKDPETAHHAPPGHMSLEIMTILTGSPAAWGLSPREDDAWGYKRNPTYLAHKRRVEDALIAMADARFPGLAARITWRESGTPVTHSRFTRATAGSAYGIALTPAQFGANRPGYEAVFDGFHLAGVSTRAGHGIVGAMSSGRGAAEAVLRALRTGDC
jgi:all-trans-retinol 13,14-reductase